MILLIVLAILLMAIAGWLLSRENFYEMLKAIKGANYLLIASAIAIYFLSMAIWAGRWQTALSFINCRISFGTRYLILCVTVFLNNISPGARVGGDPFGRIYMLRRLENTSYSSGMASLIGEFALTPLLVVSFLMAYSSLSNVLGSTLRASFKKFIMSLWKPLPLPGGKPMTLGS